MILRLRVLLLEVLFCDVIFVLFLLLQTTNIKKTRLKQPIEVPKHIKSSYLKNTKNKELSIRNVLQKATMNATYLNEFFMDLTATLKQAGVFCKRRVNANGIFFWKIYRNSLFLTRAHFEKNMLGEYLTQHYLKFKN